MIRLNFRHQSGSQLYSKWKFINAHLWTRLNELRNAKLTFSSRWCYVLLSGQLGDWSESSADQSIETKSNLQWKYTTMRVSVRVSVRSQLLLRRYVRWIKLRLVRHTHCGPGVSKLVATMASTLWQKSWRRSRWIECFANPPHCPCLN